MSARTGGERAGMGESTGGLNEKRLGARCTLHIVAQQRVQGWKDRCAAMQTGAHIGPANRAKSLHTQPWLAHVWEHRTCHRPKGERQSVQTS